MSIMIVNHIWDDDPQWLNMFQWGSKYLIIKQVSFIMKKTETTCFLIMNMNGWSNITKSSWFGKLNNNPSPKSLQMGDNHHPQVVALLLGFSQKL